MIIRAFVPPKSSFLPSRTFWTTPPHLHKDYMHKWEDSLTEMKPSAMVIRGAAYHLNTHWRDNEYLGMQWSHRSESLIILSGIWMRCHVGCRTTDVARRDFVTQLTDRPRTPLSPSAVSCWNRCGSCMGIRALN